jgi:hypothetical protein
MTTIAADPAAVYAAAYDARLAQDERLRPVEPGEDRWAGRASRIFRQDPKRQLDATAAAMMAYAEPGDVVIDVGGGAGRLGLPLALRCKEVINVEPSPSMCQQFAEVAAEAGISNARCVQQDWMSVEGVEGDLTIATHVTYFVREIVPFIEKMQNAARRRVIIGLGSPPPPTQQAVLFEAAYGEPELSPPGHELLLPVLWSLGILPDVRVMELLPSLVGSTPLASEDEALTLAIGTLRASPDDAALRERLRARFDTLFTRTPDGFLPAWPRRIMQLIVTWPTR